MTRTRRGGPIAVCPRPEHAGSWVVSAGVRHAASGDRRVFRCQPEGAKPHTFTEMPDVVRSVSLRRRPGPAAVCPVPEHAGSWVVKRGRRTVGGVERQMYRCEPTGMAAHTFGVVVSARLRAVPSWSPPPSCPDHPGGWVVRDGTYSSSSRKPRQRYRCYPTPADRSVFHRFTPVLPRDHVHASGESCAECEELRGIHRGDPTVSRRQSWSARLVAETLRDLSRGATYADVSQRMRTAAERTRTRKPTGRTPKGYTGSRLARNAWHIAADWCETYSPVLWEPLHARLLSEATAAAEERQTDASSQAGRRPMVVVIDDVPVNARFVDEDGANVSRRDYFVLVLAEVLWSAAAGGRTERSLRLRLVRAYPSNDHHAWKLLFDELGYEPDFIIADAGTGLLKAVGDYYGPSTALIPSLFHIREAVEEGLLKTPGAWVRAHPRAAKELRPELADHLAGLSKKNFVAGGPVAWTAWWDSLEDLLRTAGVPVEPTRKRRRNYEKAVAAVLPTLAAHRYLPLSTGGLEVTIRRRLEPLLANRAHAFANLERTNRLLDLVVCAEHGVFDNMAKVVELLRADSAANEGWSTPLRQVADAQPPPSPGQSKRQQRYSSLRDQQLLRDLARAKKLA